MKPLVSIIVPNYNHSKFLERRLSSIFSQTYTNFEVIILDDCSTDGSQEILSRYSKKKSVSHCIFNEVNSQNTFAQWNLGISLAKGEYIWIAESDDFCEFNFLDRQVKIHQENENISLSYSQSHKVNSEGVITGNWLSQTSIFKINIFRSDFILEGNEFIEKFLIHKNVIPNVSGVLFNSKSLKKILPLRTDAFLKYNADWFYYIQLLCNSKVGFIAESLNYFRYHSNSVIARAANESGWIKIYEMELQGRKEMKKHIKKCKPFNMDKIIEEAGKGNFKLSYLTTKGFLERRAYFNAFKIVLREPRLLKMVLVSLIRNLCI